MGSNRQEIAVTVKELPSRTRETMCCCCTDEKVEAGARYRISSAVPKTFLPRRALGCTGLD